VLCERERFVDTQAAAPEHDDQRAQAPPVAVLPGEAHDRDDLLDRRRVGRVAHPLICAAHAPRDSPERSRASGAGRRSRELRARSWDLLPIAQRTVAAALPTPAHRRQYQARRRARFALTKRKPTVDRQAPDNRPTGASRSITNALAVLGEAVLTISRRSTRRREGIADEGIEHVVTNARWATRRR
jgi:hypothetical protein